MDKIKERFITNRGKIMFITSKNIDKIKEFLRRNDVEITIITGILFILYATFLINYIAFLYFTGLIFVALGVYLLKFPKVK